MSSGLTWDRRPKAMADAAARRRQGMPDDILAIARRNALEGEASMKVSAPWSDDTGNARALLYGQASRIGNTVTLELGGGADYQIYLETRDGGRLAAVIPELRRRVPILSDDLRAYLRGVG